jgi:hypothetical protein
LESRNRTWKTNIRLLIWTRGPNTKNSFMNLEYRPNTNTWTKNQDRLLTWVHGTMTKYQHFIIELNIWVSYYDSAIEFTTRIKYQDSIIPMCTWSKYHQVFWNIRASKKNERDRVLGYSKS